MRTFMENLKRQTRDYSVANHVHLVVWKTISRTGGGEE